MERRIEVWLLLAEVEERRTCWVVLKVSTCTAHTCVTWLASCGVKCSRCMGGFAIVCYPHQVSVDEDGEVVAGVVTRAP